MIGITDRVENLRTNFQEHIRQVSMIERRQVDYLEACFFAPRHPFLSTQGDYLTFYADAYYDLSFIENPRLNQFGRPLLGPRYPFLMKLSELESDRNGKSILIVSIGDRAVYKRIEEEIGFKPHLKDFKSWGRTHNFF